MPETVIERKGYYYGSPRQGGFSLQPFEKGQKLAKEKVDLFYNTTPSNLRQF